MKNVRKESPALLNLLLIAAFLVGFTACDGEDDDGIDIDDDDVTQQDRDFATQATYGNRAEIELGGLAVDKASNAGVVSYAEMMVEDHNSALNRLQDIADDQDITLPDTMDAAHSSMYDSLLALDGPAFDSVYMAQMVMDHEATIELFNTQVQEGENDSLANYATELLPSLEMHLQEAEEIQSTVSDATADAGTGG